MYLYWTGYFWKSTQQSVNSDCLGEGKWVAERKKEILLFIICTCRMLSYISVTHFLKWVNCLFKDKKGKGEAQGAGRKLKGKTSTRRLVTCI